MANVETELKKLNKTVDEAVNMLKFYMGTSAQVKNMNERQREIIEKWADVTEESEEIQKKQRAFSERERDEKGRFIKKQENSLSSIMGIAKSVSGLFTGMIKSASSMIGNLVGGLGQQIRNIFNNLKSHFLGLFGEESEWFDILGSIKDSLMGFFGWFARGFVLLINKTPNWATKIVKTLNKMYSLQIKEFKKGFLGEKKEKKGGLLGGLLFVLGGILFAAGTVIGALVRRWLLFFEGLLSSRFGIVKVLTRVSRKFSLFWGKFIDTMKRFNNFIDRVPIINRLLRGLRFGFRVLAWPLTVILGIIDFIRGWMRENGDWKDKLVGGLTSVLHGLIDFPLDVLGWAYEKILGLFGINREGTGDRLKEMADKIMRSFFSLFQYPVKLISGIIDKFSEGNIIQEVGRKIQSTFTKILNLIFNIWNGLLEWLMDKAEKIPWIGDNIADLTGNLKAGEPQRPTNVETDPLEFIKKHGIKKYQMQMQQRESLKKAVEEGTKATKETSRKTGEAVTAMASINNIGGNRGIDVPEQRQIDDEIDNALLSMLNFNAGF